jgi:diaminopimelate decarboxylase
MNTPILPITTQHTIDGNLTIGGVSLPDLAEHYGTPLYLYDQATLDDAVTRYRNVLEAEWKDGWQVAYAAKAWLTPTLAQWAGEQHLGMDVVSEGELRIALRAGFPANRIHAHGNNKSDAFLKSCVTSGVGRVVIDHYREAERLAAICTELGTTQAVWIRLNPATAAPTHAKIETGSATSKFGASMADGAAERIAAFLLRDDVPLRWDGVHFHIGSQFADCTTQIEAIHRTAAWVAQIYHRYGWMWHSFSPGGGWAVPYTPDDPILLPETAIPLITHALREACEMNGLLLPALVLEPGREIVARAGVALYRVGAIKQAGDVTYAFIDGGMADNPRPALYDARYTAILVNRDAPATHRYCLAGPFCESGDILIEEVLLPELQEGDLLAVPVSGAYQLSMASHYNATPRPAVLWVQNGIVHLVQEREPIELLP